MKTSKINRISVESGKKKWFTVSNVGTGVLVLFFLAMLLSPDFKGKVLQGLMAIGLFQPDIPDTQEGATAAVPPAAGQDLTLMNQSGKQVQLSSLKGKVVFMNFWATWCPPCIAEMPSIGKLQERYKNNEKVAFVMVDVDGNMDSSKAFMKKNSYTLPVFVAMSEIPQDYFSGSMPTTVILDKNVNIAYHHLGGADYSNPEVAAFIEKLAR
ncbi:TlpA family protein disulfide reductase [Pedobacter suwonensis]|uniref:TlpA family protein disulfide reductase n=1 Tax=Pedobacter suwonensis TaxID=332999 RepID=UPI003674778E